jgi:hypothetical protein
VKRHVIPYGVWDTMSDQSTLYRIARPGMIVSDGDLDEDQVAGWNGVFLFPSTGGAVRLIAGRFSIGAVSPSGCRVALSPQVTKRDSYLRVLDLCMDGRNENR